MDDLTISNLEALAYHAMIGEPNCGIKLKGLENFLRYVAKEADKDKSELAALRSRIAELEAQRDTLDKVWMHVLRLNLPLSHNNSGDECEILIGGDDMIGLQEAAELIKQAVTQPTPLTPRQCNRACFERGWQAAIEAAVKMCKAFADRTNIYRDAIDTRRNRAVRGEHIIYENLSEYFRALQPPDECGDCNPLKPSEHDADFQQAVKSHLLSMESDGDRAEFVRCLGVCLLCGSTDDPCYCAPRFDE